MYELLPSWQVKDFCPGDLPAVSLVQAGKGRDAAKKLMAAGTDPGDPKREAKQAAIAAAANTFEVVAREWLVKLAGERNAGTRDNVDVTSREKGYTRFNAVGRTDSVTSQPAVVASRKLSSFVAR